MINAYSLTLKTIDWSVTHVSLGDTLVAVIHYSAASKRFSAETLDPSSGRHLGRYRTFRGAIDDIVWFLNEFQHPGLIHPDST